MANIKFYLNGCDISFVAVAPEDITLKQLLKQCDKIEPDYCACGIRSITENDIDWEGGEPETEIIIGYDSITKATECPCTIKEDETIKG